MLLFVVGCKSKEKKFDSIEIIAYRYWHFSPDDSIYNSQPTEICGFYTLINDSGNAKMGVQNCYLNYDLNFYNIKLDKKIIDDLADSMLLLKPINDFVVHNHSIYDGPVIRIRINKGKISNTITLIDHIDSTNKLYVNFYRYLYSLKESTKIIASKDTISILSRMNEFIKYSIKIDSLYYRSPIKYVPPVIVEDPEEVKHSKKHSKKD